jgi:putative tryptophan/tyrosine transport system substrate-binding protein
MRFGGMRFGGIVSVIVTKQPWGLGMRACPTFLAAISLWVVGIPAAVAAEQPQRVPQVGFLEATVRADYDPAKDPIKDALLEGLQALGYVEGKNIHIEDRVPRKPDDTAEMARDLVGRKVDVIATFGPAPIEAARRATDSIPIVVIACDRADRLVKSIARPGGNITGMACISSDLAAKRLQLMQEIVPGLSRVAVLFNGGVPAKVEELQEIRAAAKTLEIEVQPVEIRDPSGITAAFAAMKAGSPQALIALSDPLTFYHVKEIAELAAEQRLPSTYGFREYCDAGGLLCYGANFSSQVRRYSYFIDKILKGAKPGDIPIEEPTSHELIVNARVAKSLGLTLPPSILISADMLIE